MSSPIIIDRSKELTVIQGQYIISTASYEVSNDGDVTISPGCSVRIGNGLQVNIPFLNSQWTIYTKSHLDPSVLVIHTIVGGPESRLFIQVTNYGEKEIFIGGGAKIAELICMRSINLPLFGDIGDGQLETDYIDVNPPVIGFKKLHSRAMIPYRETSVSSMYGISTIDDGKTTCIPPSGSSMIDLGLYINCKKLIGCFCKLATSTELNSLNGSVSSMIFDKDYEGELSVQVFNHADTDLEIGPGKKIAQLHFLKNDTPQVFEITKNTTGQEKWVIMEEPSQMATGGCDTHE